MARPPQLWGLCADFPGFDSAAGWTAPRRFQQTKRRGQGCLPIDATKQYDTRICLRLFDVSTALFIYRPPKHAAQTNTYSQETLDIENKSMNEVDGTYGVERAHMTGCAVTENTLTTLLEQLIIRVALAGGFERQALVQASQPKMQVTFMQKIRQIFPLLSIRLEN